MEKKYDALEIFLDWLGGICAFLTVAVYGVLIIHANWNFIPNNILNILNVIKVWAPLVVVAITGLEFTRGKSLIIRLLFYLLIAIVVVFMFFPATWTEFVTFVNK